MKKIAIIIGLVVAIGAIFVFSGVKAFQGWAIEDAIEKAMSDEFMYLASTEGVKANSQVDIVNSRYHELQEAFIEGQKKWPRYANPGDIVRYTEMGKMHREFLWKDLDYRKAKCAACHNYHDLRTYLFKQYTDSGGTL